MEHFAYHLELCAPLFLLVFLGWALIKIKLFDSAVSKALSKLVFKFLMPMLLFRQMSHLSEMPPVDLRVLIAFFGSCIVVFILGRQMGRRLFALALGQNAMPTISVLIIFNVLLLWTTATACVEFGRTGGNIDWAKFVTAMKGIFKNPIVLGILIGSAWGLTGLHLPAVAEKTLEHVTAATTPMALLVVGMGLAQHSFTAALPKGCAISVMKLLVQPLLVYALCRLIGLGQMETQATTLLSSLPVAINLYIMSVEFEAEEAMASNAIFVSTLISAVTVPLTMTLLAV